MPKPLYLYIVSQIRIFKVMKFCFVSYGIKAKYLRCMISVLNIIILCNPLKLNTMYTIYTFMKEKNEEIFQLPENLVKSVTTMSC